METAGEGSVSGHNFPTDMDTNASVSKNSQENGQKPVVGALSRKMQGFFSESELLESSSWQQHLSIFQGTEELALPSVPTEGLGEGTAWGARWPGSGFPMAGQEGLLEPVTTMLS